MIHLDTTFLVDLLRERGAGRLGPAHARLDAIAEEDVAVSVHVLCELEAGAALADDPARERARVSSLGAALRLAVPDQHCATVYGRLFAELRRRGETVPAMDLLIGAAATAEGAALVTRNVRDFERIPGLNVVRY